MVPNASHLYYVELCLVQKRYVVNDSYFIRDTFFYTELVDNPVLK